MSGLLVSVRSAAEAECAQVVQAASALRQRFGNSRMTGSGSAVFARMLGGIVPITCGCQRTVYWDEDAGSRYKD